ncbi:BCCT family transporter [Sphingobacterium sp. MYb382]|uniref:BCCT family transporter n=1 Tax=Sphingobacterium sp. MYb382 TaxID=2745278 RepID=UPI0030ABE07D
MKNSIAKTTLNRGITLPSLIFIIGICLSTVLFPTATSAYLDLVKEFLFVNLNWIYVWSVTLFVLFLLFLMFSKYGKIRLGSNGSKPEYSFFSWISMLFAAGMGIGLMFFSVAEPISHYSSGVFGTNDFMNQAKGAQMYTFFHWGIHAWAIYGVVGLALGYFAYRYKLPLSLRSCFYPLLKDRINGKWGDAVDVFALCSTFFGITTTLGFGVVQINSGLKTLNIVPDTSFSSQLIIVAILITMSIFSATSGVNKGVKILSQLNVVTVLLLLFFVLFCGPTVFLIGSFTEGLGDYINNFFGLTFNTHVYESETLPWFYNWTILYWAWWISWSPYVGLFIARISRGRTIQEFIAAVLIIPALFNFIWMTVFGNSAIWFDVNEANGALSAMAHNADQLMFLFLDYLPFTEIVSYAVVIIIVIFFVTYADSGILVMNGIATKNAEKSPKWQMLFWGILLAVMALLLLNAGGLQALQTMTLITALPFAVIMLLFCVSLMKGLIIDQKYYDQNYSVATVPWSGEFWKERLKTIVSFKDRNAVAVFLGRTAKPAFEELKEEFEGNGIEAKINMADKPERIEIEIKHDVVNNFIYGVKIHSKMVSEFMVQEENLPDLDDSKTYYPKAYFGDEREGYDVQYFTKTELISDVLKHYERFIKLISEKQNEMFISSNYNKNK